VINPIDTEGVIRGGGAVGRFPGEIHEGVAWWLGACFVAFSSAARLAVGSDGRPATSEFFRRLCKGAVNAHHHACQVTAIGGITEDAFVAFVRRHQPLASAYVATMPSPDGTDVVRIHLYDEDGLVIQEDTGLARIRRMIAEDRVPRPVSDSARGTIEHCSPAVAEAAQ
jgi:phosphomannomutase